MRFASRGYRALTQTAAQVERWSVAIEDGPTYDNLDTTTDWTHFQAVQVTADLLIDLRALTHQLGTPAHTAFGVTLSWRSPVGLSGSSEIAPIAAGETSVKVDIPRGAIGRTLHLEARIVLAADCAPGKDTLAPTELGSILWSTQHRVALEGIAPRLPIIRVAPGQYPFHDLYNARWFIHIAVADLEAPIDAAVRVYMNEANENVQRMMSDPASDIARAMTASLLLDTQREFVRQALSEETGFDPQVTYSPGSLGASLAASLGLFTDDFEVLQNKATYDPAGLDVEIQGLLGLERING